MKEMRVLSFLWAYSSLLMTTTILSEILRKKFHISRAILNRKERLMKMAKNSLEMASRTLIQEGHAVSLTKDGLVIRDRDLWLVHVCNNADPLLVRGLKAKYNPNELFLICWSAKESIVRSALRGELHLAMLSRNQVIYKDTPLSKTVIKFTSKTGLLFRPFKSLVLGDDSSFGNENSLLSELTTLREMFDYMVLKADLSSKIMQLLEELEIIAQRGAEEKEMNELLIAILEAYPVEVDERVSSKPGMPDVVAYSPIWILFELKNERATRRYVDQLRGYMDWFKGSTLSPLRIPWKGLLVALDSPPDVYAYALKRDVRVISWNVLVKFLRNVFLDAVPIELLRIAIDYSNTERELSKLVSQWKKEFSLRVTLLRTLKGKGMLSKEELTEEVASQEILEGGDIDFLLYELSGPILGLIRKKEKFFLTSEGDPFSRVERAISSLRRDFYGNHVS